MSIPRDHYDNGNYFLSKIDIYNKRICGEKGISNLGSAFIGDEKADLE